MAIAMLGHKRIPSRESGVEVVVEELCTRMAAAGNNVTCYNRRGRHIAGKAYNGAALKEHKGVRIKTVPAADIKGLAAVTSSFFASACAAFGRYDIVHYHAEGPCAMMWLPGLFGKRCIATIHGLDHQRAKWGRLARAYLRLGEKTAVKHAGGIIVLNKSMQEYFRDTYGRETTIIANGVSKPDCKAPDLIRSLYSVEKDGYILYLGRIVPEKGLHYLIDAFRDVKTDKRLVIAGSSSDTEGYCREIRQSARDDGRVIFTGFVQGGLLQELYSNAYVFALPSDLEGMPLTLLEAMSYGNCCLVSDIPECTDGAEDYVLTFRRGDAGDLREKLQMLCDGEKLVSRYKSRASGFICGKYSWDKAAEETLGLYRKAILQQSSPQD